MLQQQVIAMSNLYGGYFILHEILEKYKFVFPTTSAYRQPIEQKCLRAQFLRLDEKLLKS